MDFNLEIEILGDGNCLFRCFSILIFKTQDHHKIIRKHMIEYLLYNKLLFSSSPNLEYNTIDEWIQNMKYIGEFGDALALEILSWMYEIPIHIYIQNMYNDDYIIEYFGTWFDKPILYLILRNEHYTLIKYSDKLLKQKFQEDTNKKLENTIKELEDTNKKLVNKLKKKNNNELIIISLVLLLLLIILQNYYL